MCGVFLHSVSKLENDDILLIILFHVWGISSLSSLEGMWRDVF